LSLPARRPAESSALAAALVVLIGYALGVDDPAVLAAAGVVVGGIPGSVTWLVERSRSAKSQG
jgi:hypothetical protein